MPLRQSTAEEPPLQASKWLTSQVLLSAEEMQELLHSLQPCAFYTTGSVVPKGEGVISPPDFLNCYQNYVDNLHAGSLPEALSYKRMFSLALSATPEALYTIDAGVSNQLIRICRPIIQLQPHSISYSPIDKKFRSMVFGQETIPWGIQFSYPQLYLDGTTKKIVKTKTDTDNLNTHLFDKLQKWMRKWTIPTPIIADGVLQNLPVRLGKGCLKWINNHPLLKAKGMLIKV